MKTVSKSRLYWPTAATADETYGPLNGDVKADVVIVGAGIMGLTCAIALAEQRVRVVVIEAESPGAGASGRNGGLVVPSLPRLGPADVLRLLGEEHGPRMVTMVANSAQTVFDQIEKYGMQCDAAQRGWLNPAHAAELVPGLQGRVADWRKAGSRAIWLDREQTCVRVGSLQFHGALFDPSGGHLNPYAYTQELARVAVQLGVSLFCQTPVKNILMQGREARVMTSTGIVSAAMVLQCTNAMQAEYGPLNGAVAKSLIPLNVFQLATVPVPAHIRASLLPGNEALSDTRNNLFALRYTADGRIVTGGMASLTQWRAVPRLLESLARRMERIFPQWERVEFDFIWRGVAALTSDFLPRLMSVDERWIVPLGCNGRGIAMSTALGRRLASYVIDRNPAHLPLPITRPAPIKHHGVLRYAPQLMLPLGILQDAMRR